MNSSPRILAAHKKSRYEQLVVDRGDQRIIELLDADHISVQGLKKSHEAHQRSVEELVRHLEAEGADYDLIYRGNVEDTSDYDLIVAIGGDGTVLDLSHRIGEQPILAINSVPDTSVGYFSGGTAFDFPRLLQRIIDGRIQPVQLRRFHPRIDGEVCGPPVLNDILIAHENPAAVSSYYLQIGSHPAEKQKSSGVWVTTPAGSTAAVRSAGGLVLPFGSGNLQYLVREPFPPREGGYRFLKGIQPLEDPLEVISRMRRGTVFIDGPHMRCEFPIGSSLSIDPGAPPLSIYGLQEERRTA